MKSFRLLKALLLLAALVLLPRPAPAMVYGDSHIFSRAEMLEHGIEITAQDESGPVRGLAVTVSAARTGGPPRFESFACVILAPGFDAKAAIADARQRGFVVSKKWGKEERSEKSRDLVATFHVGDTEVVRGYLLVRLNLPARNGVPVFGTYYFLLRDLRPPTPPPAQAQQPRRC